MNTNESQFDTDAYFKAAMERLMSPADRAAYGVKAEKKDE